MIEHNHFIFIAQQLHTAVRIYNEKRSLLENVNLSLREGTLPALPDSILNYLFQFQGRKMPSTALIGRQNAYTVFPTPDKFLIIGPNRIYHNMEYQNQMDFSESDGFVPEQIYECTIIRYLQVILHACNLYYEKMVSEEDYYRANFHNPSDFGVQKSYSDLVFHNREENNVHNPYSQELRMLSSIEQGDLAMLEECRQKEIKENYGTLSSDPERNYKNISICVIALVSRAAIRGGVNAELAFSLCDSYIMEIERIKNLYYLEPLVEKAKTDFCTMVKEQKEQKHPILKKQNFHPLTEKTKDYIFSHLHEKITLRKTADFLHVNPTYLSDLFRSCEGIPFTDFVIQEKLKLVKNLLIYSDYSFSEISSYLGFASQSYLGKLFKEHTGMTLREYRNYYSSREFSSGGQNFSHP